MGNDAFGKLVLRLALGGLMLFHGAAKISNPGSVQFIKGRLVDMGLPEILTYGVYVGEIVAPLMIIIGLFARLGGLLLAVNMVFAILLVHSADLLQLTKHGGWALELQGFYLFCGLAVLFMGSGRFAVRPD
jgi:putative oxidoreductase